jgi:hypothetical protein
VSRRSASGSRVELSVHVLAAENKFVREICKVYTDKGRRKRSTMRAGMARTLRNQRGDVAAVSNSFVSSGCADP